MSYRALHGKNSEISSPGKEGGRRSYGQRGHIRSGFRLMTALRVRRWVAKGDSEGRERQNPLSKSRTRLLEKLDLLRGRLAADDGVAVREATESIDDLLVANSEIEIEVK